MSNRETVEIIAVKVNNRGKRIYLQPNKKYQLQDEVVFKSQRGLEIGTVVQVNRIVNFEDITLPIPTVERDVTEEDQKTRDENYEKEHQAYEICKALIKTHQLQMKLVSCEYTLDCNKVIFNFTAEERIDFRALVKDLARELKIRIELRQIGLRDKARMLGGVGPCGRTLCCSTFLSDFEPVSIKMAKDQDLSLNPSKISGACGRLMCCLKYENDYYEAVKMKMPDIGERVETIHGAGKVINIDILKMKYMIKDDNDMTYIISIEEEVTV